MTSSASLIGAVEAGGTKFVLALANADGRLLDRIRIETRTPEATFAEMTAWFDRAAAAHGRIGAFGIASFGPIGIDPARPDYGTFLSNVKPGWQGAGFGAALARFGVPLGIDTDVNGAALAEAVHGAGRGAAVVAYTTVGTGIGTGVVAHGQVLSGASHYETGHFHPPHDRARDPFAGTCVYHGDCVEGLASGPAIMARWGQDLTRATAAQVALIGEYLAHLAVVQIGFHRPDLLVFGGGVMHAPGLIACLRARTASLVAGYLPEWSGDLSARIVAPGLGDDAGITGAIELGRRALARNDASQVALAATHNTRS